MSKTVPSASKKGASSDQYESTFFGIVNRQGALWTPLIFGSVKDAEDYRDNQAARFGPKFARVPHTHKIVPVDFLIEPRPNPQIPNKDTSNVNQD